MVTASPTVRRISHPTGGWARRGRLADGSADSGLGRPDGSWFDGSRINRELRAEFSLSF